MEDMGGRRDASAQKRWQSGGGLWYTKAAESGKHGGRGKAPQAAGAPQIGEEP